MSDEGYIVGDLYGDQVQFETYEEAVEYALNRGGYRTRYSDEKTKVYLLRNCDYDDTIIGVYSSRCELSRLNPELRSLGNDVFTRGRSKEYFYIEERKLDE